MTALVEIVGDGSLRYLRDDLPGREIPVPGAGVFTAYGIEPRGVLHIGGHHGEEVPLYQGLGFDPIVLVEPLPDACEVIRREHPDVRLIQAAVVSSGDRAVLFSRPWSMASGLSALASEDVGMTEVSTYRADWIQRHYPGCNVLVVDTQGTELDVLRSAALDALDLVVVETDDAGRDASPHAAVVEYMAVAGWRPAERWRHGQHPYSDVVFVREAPRG